MLKDVEDHLAQLVKTWICFGVNFTPKAHSMLDHSVDFLNRAEGFADMGESRVERCHQERERIKASVARLRAVVGENDHCCKKTGPE